MRNLILAQTLLPSDVMPSGRWMGLTFKELLILFGALAAVTLLLVLWAVYFRKRSRSHSHHHHHHGDSPEATNPVNDSLASASGVSGDRRYRRKRRRRREHRPRNPTLAETGGLPPVRSEQPPDPLP